jgi:hypothetical protein
VVIFKFLKLTANEIFAFQSYYATAAQRGVTSSKDEPKAMNINILPVTVPESLDSESINCQGKHEKARKSQLEGHQHGPGGE